uniref:Putative cactus n=1 Tax=Psorophora albipes TaxID=869069 RepID=T1D472_9DIPT
MHPSRVGVSSGGYTHPSLPDGQSKLDDNKYSTDSGVDSGFLSGENLNSDNQFSSSSSAEVQQTPVASVPAPQSSNQKQLQQEEDSYTCDSGVDLNSSSQQIEPMKVEDDLCKWFHQLRLPKEQPQLIKYFHQNDDGDTYLHLAVIHEAAEVAFKLISIAPRPWLDIQNDFGQTPLHLAVLTGQPRVVRRLVVAGAMIGIRDIEGNTPLHLACLHQRTDCAKELLTSLSAQELQHCSPAVLAAIKIPQDLEQWNYNGKRCVHIAAETCNIEILRYLINAGADINSREGKSGLTPLHIATELRETKLADFLLNECPKVRLEQVTYAGLTAYQLAALQHKQTLLSALQKWGAEPLSPPESDYDMDDSSEEDDQ